MPHTTALYGIIWQYLCGVSPRKAEGHRPGSARADLAAVSEISHHLVVVLRYMPERQTVHDRNDNVPRTSGQVCRNGNKPDAAEH